MLLVKAFFETSKSAFKIKIIHDHDQEDISVKTKRAVNCIMNPHVLVCQPILFFITHSWEKILATEEKT